MTTYCDRLVTCFESCLNFSALDNTWFFSSLCFLMSFKSGSCRQQQVQCLICMCSVCFSWRNQMAMLQNSPLLSFPQVRQKQYIYIFAAFSETICWRVHEKLLLKMHVMQKKRRDKSEKRTFWLPPGEPGSVPLSHFLTLGGKTHCRRKHLFANHQRTPVDCHSASAHSQHIYGQQLSEHMLSFLHCFTGLRVHLKTTKTTPSLLLNASNIIITRFGRDRFNFVLNEESTI